MAKVTVKKEGNKRIMVVEMEMGEPVASSSGKSVIVASTHGTLKTGVKEGEKEINLNLTAWVKA